MPKQILSEEEFKQVVKDAKECRIFKKGNIVKLKLRTDRILYVYKTNEEESKKLLSGLKIKIVEV